jgi:CelD/BcsL family acetyltransferase involved in cellulose biosynthesis
MLSAELIDDVAGLEPWVEAWDRLAVELAQPCGSPHWMLPWWRHAVQGRAELRSVVVRESDELVGLAPYFVQLGSHGLAEYRVLSAGAAHRIGPLAKPGREQEVAEAIAETIAGARPQPSSFIFEGVDAESRWPSLVRDVWPGALGSRLRTTVVMEAPTLTLSDPDFDTWFASRSSNFRQQMRRKGRQAEGRGGQVRMARSEEEASRDLEAMFAYHRDRWAERGLEGSLKPGIEEQMREAVARLLPLERARLWTIEADGKPVCIQYFTVAGGELTYWGGGFDPEWEDFQPAQLAILEAVKDAFARGERRVDFGGGDQRYKGRFANGDDPIAWTTIFPRNRRYPITRAQLLPKQARFAVRGLARRLPDDTQERIKRVMRRGARR